jgi:hypothetical protein
MFLFMKDVGPTLLKMFEIFYRMIIDPKYFIVSIYIII